MQSQSERAVREIQGIYQREKDVLQDRLAKSTAIADLYSEISQHLGRGESLM